MTIALLCHYQLSLSAAGLKSLTGINSAVSRQAIEISPFSVAYDYFNAGKKGMGDDE